MKNQHFNKTIHTFYEFCYWSTLNKILHKKISENVSFFKFLENLSNENINILNKTMDEKRLIVTESPKNIDYITSQKNLWLCLKQKNIKPVICFFEIPLYNYIDADHTVFGLCYRTQDNKFYFPVYYFEDEICSIKNNFFGYSCVKLLDTNDPKFTKYNQGLYEFKLINKKWVKTDDK